MAKKKIIKREIIIKEASNLFFEKGFSYTSIDDINEAPQAKVGE